MLRNDLKFIPKKEKEAFLKYEKDIHKQAIFYKQMEEDRQKIINMEKKNKEILGKMR